MRWKLIQVLHVSLLPWDKNLQAVGFNKKLTIGVCRDRMSSWRIGMWAWSVSELDVGAMSQGASSSWSSPTAKLWLGISYVKHLLVQWCSRPLKCNTKLSPKKGKILSFYLRFFNSWIKQKIVLKIFRICSLINNFFVVEKIKGDCHLTS